MTITRTPAATVLAALLIGGLTACGAAEEPGPWTEYRAEDFAVAAGERCAFPLTGTVLEDAEMIRTVATRPDGTAAVQEVTGRLVVRYTNTDTGEAVDRDLTGDATLDVDPDGSLTRLTLDDGHFAAGLAATDPGGPAFLYFSGRGHAVSYAPDGTRTVQAGDGPVEDVCDTLDGQ